MKGPFILIPVSVFGLMVGLQILATQPQVPTRNHQAIGWSTHGPYGGAVFNVAVDPLSSTVVYAAARQTGVFGTQNGGQTWTLLLHDPDWSAASDAALVTHPALPGAVLFAGSHDLYRSNDYGQSWVPIRNNGQPIEGRIIVLDPGNPNRVFIGLWAGQVLKSLDGGNSWTRHSVGMPASTPVDYLALDAVITSTLYAGSREGGGIYRSTDGGESWEPTPGQPAVSDTWSLAASPHDRGVYHGGWYGPLSYSPNQGQNWYTLTVGTAPPLHSWVTVHFHPVQTQTLYVGDIGGIWQTNDRGLDWQEIVQGAGWDIAVHPIHTNTVYAVANGVKISVDGGVNWEARNQGITAIPPREIAVAQTDPARLLVGAGYSTGFYSLNGGQNWNPTDVSIYHAVVFDPLSFTVAYVGQGREIFRSDDSGVTWARAGELSLDGLPAYVHGIETRAIAVHPATSTLIYAGVGFNSDAVPVLQEGGIYRSYDAGVTWERLDTTVPISRVNTIVIEPTPPYTMYLATGRIEHHLEQGNGLFRSTDGGQTWTAINTDLPALNMRTVVANPANPLELLCAPWEQANYSGGLGVYRSTDGGETWNAANTGLAALTVEDLEYDPAAVGVVYAATWNGLFFSTDDGQSWNRWKDAMGYIPTLSVSAAKQSENESIVYVGAVGGSVAASQSGILSAVAQTVVQAGVYNKSVRWYRVFLPVVMKW